MTGEAADEYVVVGFTSTPRWTWLLLLFGIVPFLIVRAFSKVRITGLVPMSDAAIRRGRTFNRSWGGLAGAAIAMLVIGMVADLPGLAWVGVVTLIAALSIAVIGWSFVWPSGSVSDDVVWLSFVDGRFAEALDRRYGDA